MNEVLRMIVLLIISSFFEKVGILLGKKRTFCNTTVSCVIEVKLISVREMKCHLNGT